MRPLAVAARWFERRSVDADLTLLWEPEVHGLLRCNIWHLRGRDRDVFVDTGVGVSSLVDAARDLLDKPVLAVVTHAHMDHVGGFHEFDHRAIHAAEAVDAATAAGAFPLDVADYDDDTLDALASWGEDIRGGLLTALPDESFDLRAHRLTPAAATWLLEDGDVIDLGDRAYEVLHVPGHSPGSIALWNAHSRELFSGDAVYDGNLLDELPGSDIDDYVASMRRLRDLPIDVAHGGHGPSMDRRRFTELIDDYLRRRAA
jgi:glyoxylase-like metal-dependent hydrolase (beta-lactamase superfamily II)